MAEVGLVAFAQIARQVAEAVVPAYKSKYSKRVFTQPQLLGRLGSLLQGRPANRRYGTLLLPDAEADSSLGDALIMPGHPIALAEFGSGPYPLVIVHRTLDDLLILVVVVLELTWRMKLQHAGNLCACVAEGVVNPSWLEDERASLGDDDLATDVKGQLTLQHEGALVLAGVGVWRDHVAGRNARLDTRKRAAKALRRHLVGYAQDGKVGAFIRTD
jgi:hypothetical protein